MSRLKPDVVKRVWKLWPNLNEWAKTLSQSEALLDVMFNDTTTTAHERALAWVWHGNPKQIKYLVGQPKVQTTLVAIADLAGDFLKSPNQGQGLYCQHGSAWMQ